MKAAFNADRKALQEKIEHLEESLLEKQKKFDELASKLVTNE